MQQHLTHRGLAGTIAEDHAVAADGTRFGLWNLAANAANDPDGPAGWPALVQRHLDQVIGAMEGSTDLSEETLAEHLLVRLMDERMSGAETLRDYAPDWMPGVLQALVVDLPEAVRTLSASDARTLQPLWPGYELGLRNLAREFQRAQFDLHRVGDDQGNFELAVSEWVYTSSIPLLFPGVLGHFAPGADVSKGVLFCVPHRHQFAFHIISDPEQAMLALTRMPVFAARGYDDGVGPLSPHTYLWLDGEITQLTEFGDGKLKVKPGAYLEGLMADGN